MTGRHRGDRDLQGYARAERDLLITLSRFAWLAAHTGWWWARPLQKRRERRRA